MLTATYRRWSHSLVKPSGHRRADGRGAVLVRRQEPQQRQGGCGRNGAGLDPAVGSYLRCVVSLVSLEQPQRRWVVMRDRREGYVTLLCPSMTEARRETMSGGRRRGFVFFCQCVTSHRVHRLVDERVDDERHFDMVLEQFRLTAALWVLYDMGNEGNGSASVCPDCSTISAGLLLLVLLSGPCCFSVRHFSPFMLLLELSKEKRRRTHWPSPHGMEFTSLFPLQQWDL